MTPQPSDSATTPRAQGDAPTCAHCSGLVPDDARRCRHGLLCGKCEWELDVYSGVHGDEARS